MFHTNLEFRKAIENELSKWQSSPSWKKQTNNSTLKREFLHTSEWHALKVMWKDVESHSQAVKYRRFGLIGRAAYIDI